MRISTHKALILAAGLAVFGEGQDIPVSNSPMERPALRRQNFLFSNMDLRSAFKAVSASGAVDIVLAPDVAGKVVSLQLTDKTWQEALLILCQMYNLKYLVEENYLYVLTMTEYNSQSVDNATAAQTAGSMAPLIRDIIKLRNAKARDLESSVTGLLSPRGKLNIVERNNAMLVFDTRQNIREIRAAVRALDVETHQVNILAHLIQVDSDALQELGVDWQFGSGNITQLSPTTAGKVPSLPAGSQSSYGVLGGTSQGGVSTGTGAGAGSGTGGSSGESGQGGGGVAGVAGATSQVAFGLLNGNLAIAVANLLQTAKGEVLAKPQITTLDNTQARIFMGEQVPIRVLDANGRQAIELQDAGTSLQVTPHVTADGRILLDLNPEKNSFRVDPSAGTILQKQSAKTTVVVNDGETVVIAGLTTKEETETEKGVPFLKDIPIIGYLFKHKAVQSRKRDLIIFVTPHIVRRSLAEEVARTDILEFEDAPLSERPGVYGDMRPQAPAAAPAAPAGLPAAPPPIQSAPSYE